jgi:PHS family inorganic phosphate transporter-like MFS transporter
MGVGGEYPLAAAIASESAPPARRAVATGAVFAMQGAGHVLAAAVVTALLQAGVRPDVAWRVALALGAAPGLLAAPFRWRMAETEPYARARAALRTYSTLPFLPRVACALRVYARDLVGTAGAWFLLGAMFYGNSLFSTTVLRVLGLGRDLPDQARNALYVALVALPGYALAVLALPRMARFQQQWLGFSAAAAVFFGLGYAPDRLAALGPAFLALYGLSFLVINAGPNTTVFVLPAEYYPPQVRATCHGLSAAVGRLGGAAATYAFPHLREAIGLGNLLLLCSGLAALGSAWTLLFTPACVACLRSAAAAVPSSRPSPDRSPPDTRMPLW